MGTQGLVTVASRGKVVAKITAGDNGQKAKEVAEAIALHLNCADPTLLMTIAKQRGFGCEKCRTVATRAGGEVWLLQEVSINEHVVFTVNSEDEEYGLWAKTFDIPLFNPRWRHGTADHCYLVNMDDRQVAKKRYLGAGFVDEVAKPKGMPRVLKVKKLGDGEWDVYAGKFDFHIKDEEDSSSDTGKTYAVDVFRSGVKDANRAHVDVFSVMTLDDALDTCAIWQYNHK